MVDKVRWQKEGQGDLISTILIAFTIVMAYVLIYIGYTLFGFWYVLPFLLVVIVATILFIRGVVE